MQFTIPGLNKYKFWTTTVFVKFEYVTQGFPPDRSYNKCKLSYLIRIIDAIKGKVSTMSGIAALFGERDGQTFFNEDLIV